MMQGKFGGLLVLLGSVAAIYNVKLGMIIAVVGIALVTFSDEGDSSERNMQYKKDEKDKTVKLEYKVVDGHIVMLDDEGNVLGVAKPATPAGNNLCKIQGGKDKQ